MSDIFLIQLFSSPQQQVANITKREPIKNWKLPLDSNDNTILDNITNPIAVQSFPDTFSLKMNKAISVVATISKLPRSDTLDAVPTLIPNIKNIGAAISRLRNCHHRHDYHKINQPIYQKHPHWTVELKSGLEVDVEK